MKTLKFSLMAVLVGMSLGQVQAQDAHAGHHPQADNATKPSDSVQASAADAATSDMADGTIKKMDPALGKVTLKHGEIKSLQMPPMTMIYKANPELLKGLQVGGEVKFAVDSKMNITRIEKK